MSKKNRKGVVYSTNPNYEYELNDEEQVETLDAAEQQLYVSLDKKDRKGKIVTLVSGFVGNQEDLKDLSKTLKSKCGVGGSVKDREIIIQGAFKDQIAQLLRSMNYSVKVK